MPFLDRRYTKIVESFKKNGREIGKGLSNGLKESEIAYMLGKCAKCGKVDLIIKKSRNNKQFVGCSNWPECNNSYPLPQYARIVPLHKICEKCGAPRVKVFAKGKVYEMCVNPECETKQNWKQKKEEESKTANNAAPPANIQVSKQTDARKEGAEIPQEKKVVKKETKKKKENGAKGVKRQRKKKSEIEE